MSAVHELRSTDEPGWLLRKSAPVPRRKSIVASGSVRAVGAPTDTAGAAANDAGTDLVRSVRAFGALVYRYIDRLGEALMQARLDWVGADRRQIEKYLSESTDLADLERRVRDLDRNGWRLR